MNRNLFFGLCLAPYRIDFYNYLYKEANTDIWFLRDRLAGQDLDFSVLWSECDFPKKLLSCCNVGGRQHARNLKKIIDDTKPNVVYVSEFSIIAIQVVLLRFLFRYKYKIISICDDSIDMLEGKDFSRVHTLARKAVAPFFDDIVLCDTRSVEWYNKHYHKGKWFPIIAKEERMEKKFKDAIPLSESYIERYSLKNKKIILFVGRLVYTKNVPTLIEAYHKVLDGNTILVIVGDGELRGQLEQQSMPLDNHVLFTGKLEGKELFAWYNIADVFVLPSYKEAFGAVTNEALLAGCRVCISENCGSACIVTDDNGETFNPTHSEQLSLAIISQLRKCETGVDKSQRSSLMPFTFNHLISQVFKMI